MHVFRIFAVTLVAIVVLVVAASVLPLWVGRVLTVLIGLAVIVEGLWIIWSVGSPPGRRLERTKRLTDKRLRAEQNAFVAATGEEMTPGQISAARKRIARGERRVITRGIVRGVQPPKGHSDGPQ